MKRVLFILALMMPMIFMCSCSDDDKGIIKKGQLIGTWLIVSEIEDYTKVEIVFEESNKFELTTYLKIEADDGTIIEKGGTIRGTYTLKNDKITFDNKYSLLMESFENDTIEGKIDFGNGMCSVIGKKQ